jgi:hypothetical protein
LASDFNPRNDNFRIAFGQMIFFNSIGVSLLSLLCLVSCHTGRCSGMADPQNFTSNLPLVIVDTLGQAITNRDRIKVSLSVFRPQHGRVSFPEAPEYTGGAEIWIRGSGSVTFPKKSYRLELQDEEGRDQKVSLLGMPAESDWILLADYTDRTLMRDVLASELWHQMGYYAPRTRYVELFVIRTNNSELNRYKVKSLNNDGSHPEGQSANSMLPAPRSVLPPMSDYEGVYVLIEKIKRGKERLNIQKLRPTDTNEPALTGGYIFKKDRVNPGEHGFKSSRGIEFAFEEPKERDIAPAQAQWLSNYVNELEQALFSRRFAEPAAGYERFIDVDSFIDYHWFIEISKNVDAHWFSQFFHKDRAGKLQAGPVWDWDMGWGNAAYLSGRRTNGWRWEQVKGSDYAWYDRLFEDGNFLQRYIDRWSELRTNVFARSNILTRIDALAREIEPAAIRNHQRWFPPRDEADTNRLPARRFQAEVDRMKRWIAARLDWIDSQDFPKPVAVVATPEGGPGEEVRLACLTGTIYYTLDGSDPRLRGGAISPKASQYKEPIPIGTAARLMARVRSEYDLWSAPAVLNFPSRPNH